MQYFNVKPRGTYNHHRTHGVRKQCSVLYPKRVSITTVPSVYRNTSHSKIPHHQCKPVRRYKGIQKPEVTRHTRTTLAVFRKKTSAVRCLHAKISGLTSKASVRTKTHSKAHHSAVIRNGMKKSFTLRPSNYPLR
jgi:hypothetical protein